jgi:comEA protein
MAKIEEKKENSFQEKAKIIILAVAVVAVLGGTFALFWQVNEQNRGSKSNTTNDQTSKEIDDLNKKIDDLNTTLNEVKNASPEETVVSQKVTTSGGTVAGASTQAVGGKVNLNSASLSALDTLPGIGAAYAQRIIDYRTANGGFKSIDEIKNIKGIGDKTFEKLKDQITI